MNCDANVDAPYYNAVAKLLKWDCKLVNQQYITSLNPFRNKNEKNLAKNNTYPNGRIRLCFFIDIKVLRGIEKYFEP